MKFDNRNLHNNVVVIFKQLKTVQNVYFAYLEAGDIVYLRRSYTYRPFRPKLPKKIDKKYCYNKKMKIYCKYNLFSIKEAKAEVLKLTLSSFIAFSRKTACRNLSLEPHVGFSWDKEQIVHNLCSYGCKSCNLKVFMCKYFFHDKNPKNSKKWKKLLQKNQFLA